MHPVTAVGPEAGPSPDVASTAPPVGSVADDSRREATTTSGPRTPSKPSRYADFWRATAFLARYRRWVIASALCAFFSSAFFTGGLSVLGPVLKVLIEGQTVRGWAAARTAGYAPGEPPAWWRGVAGLAERVPDHPTAAVATLFGVIVILGIFGHIVRFFAEYLSDKTAIHAVNDVRRRLYDRILHVPLGYFGTRGTSDVTSRLVADAAALQEGFKVLLGRTVQEPIGALFVLGLALWIDWRLTLFIVVFTPLIFVALRKFGKKMRRASRIALESNAAMLGQLDASLHGLRVVKAAGGERYERRRYETILHGLKRQQMKMARYEAYSSPVLETLGMVAAGGVLIVATHLVTVRQELAPSSFFVVIGCLVALVESLRKISKVNNIFARGNAAATRIFETMDLPTEQPRVRTPATTPPKGVEFGPSALPPIPVRGDVAFEDVSFAYSLDTPPAVDRVTLRVPAGTSVAIVGRNGSGKTTLLSLLPRFYDPTRGRVTVDGVDVRHWPMRRLRRQIAVVTQDPVVFPGTIHENIAYARPAATREQVTDAASRAYAHDFITARPTGYDTPLDGLGGQLSGGQKQRLNIARAMLRDAPILILDEATSQVDAESEHLIQRAIAGLIGGRTTFVIAHRFSTILDADQIAVMDAGRLIAVGRHDDLMRRCDTYRQLYERQAFAA